MCCAPARRLTNHRGVPIRIRLAQQTSLQTIGYTVREVLVRVILLCACALKAIEAVREARS